MVEGGEPKRCGDEDGPVARNEIGNVSGTAIQAGYVSIGTLNIGAGGGHLVPRQIPSLEAPFVNREADIQKLDRLTRGAGQAGHVPVGVITGPRGIGKTMTARYWAHANAERFTGGNLYADLAELRHRGGVDVGDVLGGFLHSLGIQDESAIPRAPSERAAMFRSVTADRRLLLLLDNVENAAEVTQLIPAGEGSVVLVTSGSRLGGLIRDGAGLVHLDPLDRGAARKVLAGLGGEEEEEGRLASELEALDRLVGMCAGLPLALRICGAILALDEQLGVASLVDRLADESKRLRQMTVGPGGSIRAVFSDAYRSLGASARGAYVRLALHPGPSFTPVLAAVALDVDLDTARSLLDELRRFNLLEVEGGRLRFHELIRLHARETAALEVEASEREAVVGRIVSFYVDSSQRMDRAIIPIRLRLAEASAPASPHVPSFAATVDAIGWFEEERPNLVAALREAADREWDQRAWVMGEALWLAYHNRKHYQEAVEVYVLAAKSARRCGDVEAEARLRNQLVRARLDLGQIDLAEQELSIASALAAESGNRALQASITEFSGILEINRGCYPEAIEALESARDVYTELSDARGIAIQEYHLGRAFDLAGDHLAAIACLRRALRLIDAEVDGLTRGRVLIHLGEAERSTGALGPAGKSLRSAIDIMRGEDAPYYEALARERLAWVQRDQGDWGGARLSLKAALAVHEQLGTARAGVLRRELADLPAG